jgi:quinoprotein glucose dehydrogenase
MSEKDLVTPEDTTPEHAQACKELWDRTKFRNEGPYTPWLYKPNGGPPTLIFPGFTGGTNWGGTATDPKLGYIFVNSKDEPSSGWIQPNPRYNENTKDTSFPYSQTVAAPSPPRRATRMANRSGTFPASVRHGPA